MSPHSVTLYKKKSRHCTACQKFKIKCFSCFRFQIILTLTKGQDLALFVGPSTVKSCRSRLRGPQLSDGKFNQKVFTLMAL